MAKVTIDLTNYKDRVGARVKPGRYRVQVEDVEETTARTGNTMINLFLRVIGGEFDGANLMDRLVLTEKSLFRVVGFMQAIGIPTPKKRLSIDINKFVGKVLDVDVEDGEPYQGRVRSEIRGYMKAEKVKKDQDLEVDDEEVEEEEEVEVEEAPKKKAKKKAEPEESDDDEEVTDEEVDLEEVEL